MYEFDAFRFDADASLLTREGRRIELTPKALAVLAALVGRAQQVVSKDELLRAVWPEAVVEEGNLAVHVSSLRKALGPGTIETLPRRGYRFAARVRVAQDDDWRGMAELYLQQQTSAGCRRAAAVYRQAGDRVGLANTLLLRLVLGDVPRDAAVTRARALLEGSGAEARLSRARLLCFDGQCDRADEELSGCAGPMALAWQGLRMVERGETDRGVRRLEEGRAAAPLSPFSARLLADALLLARDFAGCVASARKSLTLHPHCWTLHRAIGRALTILGDFDAARRNFRRATQLGGRLRAEVAYLEAKAGRREVALRWAEGARPKELAMVRAALDDRDGALDSLEQAVAERDWSLSSVGQDCRFDALRVQSRRCPSDSPHFRSAT
jgi:DNA-binding winged helix-turn-helix (wHTH) protein